MTETTGRHIVTKDIDLECPGEFTYTWECPGPKHCSGFQECCETRPEDDPCSGDELELHGVVHTYHDGYGWTVPYQGCVLAPYQDLEVDDALLYEPPGRYVIDIYWNTPEEPYIDGVERVTP